MLVIITHCQRNYIDPPALFPMHPSYDTTLSLASIHCVLRIRLVIYSSVLYFVSLDLFLFLSLPITSIPVGRAVYKSFEIANFLDMYNDDGRRCVCYSGDSYERRRISYNTHEL